MHKMVRWLMLIALLATSLTCNLPMPGSAVTPLTQLEWMRARELELGDALAEDANSDGRLEKVSYSLPAREIQTQVNLVESLYAQDTGGGLFTRALVFDFTYTGAGSASVSHIVDVPKEFAANVDELGFSIPPSQVIEADPKIRFDFALGRGAGSAVQQALVVFTLQGNEMDFDQASRSLMVQAAKSATRLCNEVITDPVEKELCYLNLVGDFKDYVTDLSDLDMFCARTTGMVFAMCQSILHDTMKCAALDNTADQDLCKAYVLAYRCDAKPPAERFACQREQAIAAGCKTLCMALPDDDMRYDCLARAVKDARYCDRVRDETARARCKGDLGDVKPNPWSFLIFKTWFPPDKAAGYCARFDGIFPGLFPIWADADGNSLHCHYSDRPVGDTRGYNQYVMITLVQYDSETASRDEWESHRGMNSPLYQNLKRLAEEDEAWYVNHTGDWYMTLLERAEGEPPDFEAYSIYGQAQFEFRAEKLVSNVETGVALWESFEPIARGLVDEIK